MENAKLSMSDDSIAKILSDRASKQANASAATGVGRSVPNGSLALTALAHRRREASDAVRAGDANGDHVGCCENSDSDITHQCIKSRLPLVFYWELSRVLPR